MRILKPAPLCPLCGQPLRQTDSKALRLLAAAIADIAGPPEPGEEAQTDERDISCSGGRTSE